MKLLHVSSLDALVGGAASGDRHAGRADVKVIASAAFAGGPVVRAGDAVTVEAPAEAGVEPLLQDSDEWYGEDDWNVAGPGGGMAAERYQVVEGSESGDVSSNDVEAEPAQSGAGSGAIRSDLTSQGLEIAGHSLLLC